MIKEKTKTGIEVEISTKPSTVSADMETVVQFSHPTLKFSPVTDRIFRTISEEQSNKGIWASSHPLKTGGSKRIFLAFPEEGIRRIKEYFQEQNEKEKDRKTHWMEINLGVCFNSDYSCHWWRGDNRTSYEQILKEGKDQLNCCHKEESIQNLIRTAYDKYWKQKEKVENEKKEREERNKKALLQAQETGKPVLLYHYSADCNDANEDCDVDNIYIYMLPNGKQKEERNHSW